MAQRRMLSLKVIDTDTFLEMPVSARLLYYDLNMRADDDGFVSNPKKILNFVKASEDDYKVLCAKQYVIPFETGVCVIRHWHIHNLIRHDRYNETEYKQEKSILLLQNNKYELNGIQNVIPNDSQMATQVRLGKDRIGKKIIRKTKVIDPIQESIITDIINSYPLKCPIRNISLYPDSKANRETIEKLLKKISKDEIIKRINIYLKESTSAKVWLKVFKNVLEIIPSIKDETSISKKHVEPNGDEYQIDKLRHENKHYAPPKFPGFDEMNLYKKLIKEQKIDEAIEMLIKYGNEVW
jgi:hypothetical protein